MFRFFRNLIRTTKDTLTFIASLGRSGFAQEVGKNTGQWFSHAADSVIVGASVFVTHLGLSFILPPAATLGAIGVGLLVRHRLNKVRGLDKIRSPARKTTLTLTTVAGAIAGGTIAGPLAAPLGLAAGAAIGNFSGNLILNTVSNLTSPSGGALNLFTRATENLPFLPSALTPPRPRTLGCLLLTVILIPTLVLIFTATVILSIFLLPRTRETTEVPPTDLACLSFDNSWETVPDQKDLISQAVANLTSKFPGLLNLACHNRQITLIYNPTIVKYCGLVSGRSSLIYFDNFSLCTTATNKQSFSAYALAHELGHFVIFNFGFTQEFFSTIGGEGVLNSYPEDAEDFGKWFEDLPESIAIYARCKIFSDYCHFYQSFPKHMQFVEQFIGTVL